jgi:hypothetical protein
MTDMERFSDLSIAVVLVDGYLVQLRRTIQANRSAV